MDKKLNMEIPLDKEGFALQQCQSCHNNFKIKFEDGHEGNKLSFCPYCKTESDNFFTNDQVKCLKEIASKEVLSLINKEFENLSSKGIKFESTLQKKSNFKLTDNYSDFFLVNFLCCNEAVKILNNWPNDVYCVICGKGYKPQDLLK